MGSCDPGLREQLELTVTDENTATAVGSGDVPVLATPAILALAERACVGAIDDDLEDGQTSVGVFVELEHLLPSAVGATVAAEATLIGHHGRRLEFRVVIREGDEVVAKVHHRRVLVDRERFLAKAPSNGAA
jgi:fluoroacetyl-CoA thioesterase